ncbi:MAG: hypothetical protein FWD15_05165 [Alphaproteobacteria bacterium]|nr:hypothetical protein [Alphaproteobacteria bacterium]
MRLDTIDKMILGLQDIGSDMKKSAAVVWHGVNFCILLAEIAASASYDLASAIIKNSKTKGA